MAVPTFEEYAARVGPEYPELSQDDLRVAWQKWDRQENPNKYAPDLDTYRARLADHPDFQGLSDDDWKTSYEKAFPFSTWDAAASGLAGGMYGLAYSSAGILEAMGANDLGADLKAYAEKGMQDNMPRAGTVDDIWENPERLADPRTWAYGGGNMLPSVAASMIPGGLAFRAAGGTAAMAAGSRAPQLAAMAGGGAAGGALEAGPAYYSALEKGMSHEEARAHALKFGGVVAGLNALPVGAAFSKLGKFGWPGRAAGTGVAEAITEVAEGPAEALLLGEDMWEALKAEADVAPGALLAGAIFGAAGSPTKIDPVKAIPEVTTPTEKPEEGPLQEAVRRAILDPDQEGAAFDQAMLNFEDAYATHMEGRLQEAQEIEGQIDEAYAGVAQQKAQEEETMWLRHRASMELPTMVRDGLIRAEIERAYSGKEPTQAELAMREQIPAGLPPSVQSGYMAAMQSRAPEPDRSNEALPDTKPLEPGVVPNAVRTAELEDMANTGRMPARPPTLNEERILNRAQMSKASGVLPDGYSVSRTLNGEHEVRKDGNPVGAFPTSLGAHMAAQSMAEPAVTIEEAQAQEPFIPVDNMGGFRAIFSRPSWVRRGAAAMTGRLDPTAYAPIPDQVGEIPLGRMDQYAGIYAQALDTQATNRAQLSMLTPSEAQAMESLLNTLVNFGVPRETLDGVTAFVTHTGLPGTQGTSVRGLHMKLGDGSRAISVARNMLQQIATGTAVEDEYLSALFTLAHEVGHYALNEYAMASPAFAPGGTVFDELAEAWIDQVPVVGQEFGYPFAYLAEHEKALEAKDKEKLAQVRYLLRTEAAAQLFASYYVYGQVEGDVIQESIPLAWGLMREVNDALKSESGARRNEQLLGAFRVPGSALAGTGFDAGPIGQLDYGSNQDRYAAGSPGRLDAGRRRGSKLLKPEGAISYDERLESSIAEAARSHVSGDGGSGAAGYGARNPGSTQALGVHFSPRRRETLDSSQYGTGKRGAERARLDRPSADPAVRNRIYFYVDEGNGIHRESGVGAQGHSVQLNNLYNWNTDKLGFWDKAAEQYNDIADKTNVVESLIHQNGYDGLLAPGAFGRQGVAVLLGDHQVTIEEANADRPVRHLTKHFREEEFREVKGKRAGMPDHIQTEADVNKLVKSWLKELETADPALLNEEDWTWYERVGEHIRLITHGDKDEMERMVRILALLSSDDTVQNNTNGWVRSAYEMMAWMRAGREIEDFAPKVGRYPDANGEYIRVAMQAPEFTTENSGVGHKVMNFYRNLHDAAFEENRWPGAGTIDRWMLWSFGFPNTVKSAGSKPKANPLQEPGKYRYGMAVLKDITDRYNRRHGTSWLPRNLQAAIWTLKMNQDRVAQGLKPVHEDYVQTLRQATQTVTAEAVPSPDSARDDFIVGLPFARKEEYTRRVWDLLTGPNGENLLAQKLGMPLHNTQQRSGAYQGDLSPNILFSPVALKTNGTWDKTLVDAYARSLQFIFQQNAVPWMRMDHAALDRAMVALRNGTPGPTLSVKVNLGRSLSSSYLHEVMEKMEQHGVPGEFTQVTDSEILVANFGGDQEFLQKMDALAVSLDANNTVVGMEGDYGLEADWRYDPTGRRARLELRAALAKAYNLGGAERSDLFRWILDRSEKVGEVTEDFKQTALEGVTIEEVSEDLGPDWIAGTTPADDRYVGSINLEHLRTREDIEGFLRTGWQDFHEAINKRRRHVRDWGTTEAAARTLGVTPEEMLKMPLGQAANAETLEWARMVLEQAGQDLMKANNRYQELPVDTRKVELEMARKKFLAIQAVYSGIATEAGRALNILRKQSQDVKNLSTLARDLDMGLDLDQYSAMLAQLEDTGQIADFTRKSDDPKWSDKLLEVWINFLLSGPQTQATNVLSNTVVSLFSNVEMLMAAGVNALTGGGGVNFRQAAAYAAGTLNGAARGLGAAGKAFMSEEGSGQYKIDVKRYRAIPGPAGRLIRVPGRALLAGDEFFKSVARSQFMNMIAMEQAQLEHESLGTDVHVAYKRLLANPTEGMQKQAQEWADYQTYTNRLGEFGQAVQKMAATHPVMRIVFPFIRTPVNIVKFALHRLPSAVIFKDFREEISGKHGKRKRDVAMARVIVGSSIAALLAQYVAQGLITGGGPDDPKERGAKYANGWQPYSIRIGDEWHSYARMEPLGILLGVTSDVVEISDAWGDIESEDIAGLLVASLSNNLTSKTFLRGLSELVNVLNDPTRYGDRYVQNLAGTVIPTLFSQITRVNDPALREVRSITDKIKSRVPGESYALPLRHDILGNEIRLEGSAGPDLLSPIYVSRIRNNPVIQAMIDSDYYPGMPSKKIGGVELPPAVYQEYAKLANGMAARTLGQYVGTSWFSSLPKAKRGDLISDAYRKARRQARYYILAKHPELLAAQREMRTREALEM